MARKYRKYTTEELTKWIGELVARDDLHAFYISTAWVKLRAEVLKDQHYECQSCKQRGEFQPATVVHHVKTVRRCPWLALTKSNLMALCDECHYQIHHPHKSKWDDERW